MTPMGPSSTGSPAARPRGLVASGLKMAAHMTLSGNLTPRVVVIGYGSTLHSDDAAGQRVAEIVQTWNAPDVRAISSVQLLPEHAEALASADVAVFVDAGPVTAHAELRECALAPDAGAALTPHFGDPRALLALSHALYGRWPAATMLVVPGLNFDLGDVLSPAAQRGIADALRRIGDIVDGVRASRTPSAEHSAGGTS